MPALPSASRLAFGVAFLAAGGVAHADVIYELGASTGAGATDNARVAGSGTVHTSGSYGMAAGNLRVRYRGIRVEHGLGYRLAFTQFFMGQGQSTLAHQLALNSSFALSPRWTMGLGAIGTLTRTSTIDPIDPVATSAQPNVPGSILYLHAAATESASYQPTPRQSYGQSLMAALVRYLEAPSAGMVSLPDTMIVSLALHGTRQVARERFSVEAALADSFTNADPALGRGTYARGHTFVGRALAGWGHELSPTWTTLVQAGPSIIFKLDGSGVIAPAVVLALNYQRTPWFASVIASQTPMPNLYIGGATLNDQIMFRAAIALTRNERVYLGGSGGYVYARFPNDQSRVSRAYDQFVGGASLAYRFQSLPLGMALSYTVISQRGSMLPNYAVPDLARQAVFLTLRGEFAWGPGTPPLFGGVL